MKTRTKFNYYKQIVESLTDACRCCGSLAILFENHDQDVSLSFHGLVCEIDAILERVVSLKQEL